MTKQEIRKAVDMFNNQIKYCPLNWEVQLLVTLAQRVLDGLPEERRIILDSWGEEKHCEVNTASFYYNQCLSDLKKSLGIEDTEHGN